MNASQKYENLFTILSFSAPPLSHIQNHSEAYEAVNYENIVSKGEIARNLSDYIFCHNDFNSIQTFIVLLFMITGQPTSPRLVNARCRPVFICSQQPWIITTQRILKLN